MPAQYRAAPIAIGLKMLHQVSRCPICGPRRVKRPIIAPLYMDPGIDLKTSSHAARAGGGQQPARFFACFREMGAATQIERIGMQPAFIERYGRQQPFRQAMGDFSLPRGSQASGAG
jgi:hypothetical protein